MRLTATFGISCPVLVHEHPLVDPTIIAAEQHEAQITNLGAQAPDPL